MSASESKGINLKNFYLLITVDKAYRQWIDSGKRCSFGIYTATLQSLGYKIV